MPEYRLYRMTKTGTIFEPPVTDEFPNDAAALEKLSSLLTGALLRFGRVRALSPTSIPKADVQPLALQIISNPERDVR